MKTDLSTARGIINGVIIGGMFWTAVALWVLSSLE